ncbi:MAG: aldo/keto reductase [Planctomycetes bacterium]|nr:aldo/keto reductase [Planctomycetota bacterium]
MRLAIGTAQFGLPYGVANRIGQVSAAEAREILRRAAEAGVDTIDTAMAYGNSEQRLGEIGVKHFKVVTKLPAAPVECTDLSAWMMQSVEESLKRLGVAKLEGLLLHKPSQLLEVNGKKMYDTLTALKKDGFVNKIGVSIYEPCELEPLTARFHLDLVQAPFNVLDQRLRTSGWLDKLAEQNIEVHVRSIFLQGLLLMDEASRPEKFNRWGAFWIQWHKHLRASGRTALEACLDFAISEKRIHRLVVGVESLVQFEECLQAMRGTRTSTGSPPTCDDVQLMDPRAWSALV